MILVRDSEQGIETLLLQRNPDSSFLPEYWVFPGGAVEEQDGLLNSVEADNTYRTAAARETLEECGVRVNNNELVSFSRWIAPAITAKRFDTRFYLSAAQSSEVNIDGCEITNALWLPVDEALKAHQREELKIMPPTLVSLTTLASFNTVTDLLLSFAHQPLTVFEPKAVHWQEQLVMLYQEDAGYQTADPEIEGVIHRCVLTDKCWEYHRQQSP